MEFLSDRVGSILAVLMDVSDAVGDNKIAKKCVADQVGDVLQSA